jgi:LPS-assembly lipoprotein
LLYKLASRRAVLLALLAVGACGFTPALAPGGDMLKLRNTVAVSAPDTIAGFAIRSRLIDRLGRATAPIATLSVNVEEALDVAAQSQSGATLRYNVVGAAGWQLTAADGTVWGSGQVDGFTSYAATGSTVATQSAATDAVGRLMIILGDKVVAQLMLLDLPQ